MSDIRVSGLKLTRRSSFSLQHHDIFRRLAALYRPSRPRTQVEVLQTLPHQTARDKTIRKWLAWAFMCEDDAFEKVVNDEVGILHLRRALSIEH